MADYLWTDNEWTFKKLDATYQEIEKIGVGEMGLDIYPNQIEVITSEQMVDAYASIGLPIYYHHWSFGKHFTRDWQNYQAGRQGLAYEIVINSDPCISYLMEENTMTMQALVMAHACVSGDTEYLSPTGWKQIASYDGGLVGQYHADGRVTFVQPQRYIERDQADFIHVTGPCLSQAITADHTVIVHDAGQLRKLTGSDLERNGTTAKFITAFQIERKSLLPLTDDELRLYVAIKSKGVYLNLDIETDAQDVSIYLDLEDEHKVDRLTKLLERLNITHETVKMVRLNRRLVVFGYRRIGLRYSPDWYTASPAQTKVISEELQFWHGLTAYSFYKSDADYIQYVWAATGQHAELGSDARRFTVTRSDEVLVRTDSEPFRRMMAEPRAYCFTLDTGMFVIRHRNSISVTGNCMGHNTFFKTNAMFREWTDATSIIDYLIFARDYIAKCEVREGRAEVERFLDACHAMMNYGINRYKRPAKLSVDKEKARSEKREAYRQSRVNELFDTLIAKDADPRAEVKKFPPEPEENLLYFCEKYSDLPEWKREIMRIVRKVSQYFYPQMMSKLTNEGAASYNHYRIMHRLHEKGLITDGAVLEFLQSHSNVVYQPDFNSPHYSGINPYALGFAMMRDIERICREPTKEDRRWFPDIAGCQDEMAVLRHAWANFRDESFIQQYLSPAVIRKFRLFQLTDLKDAPHLTVTAIHDDRGYDDIRQALAANYERQAAVPPIEAVAVDPKSRHLTLCYHRFQGRSLDNVTVMLKHIETLWGNSVSLFDNQGNPLR